MGRGGVVRTPRGSGSMRWAAQGGDIIVGWLVKIVAFVAVVGLVAFEAISIAVTAVSLDDNAREVARAARDAYRAEQSLEQAEETAQEVAATHGVTVVSLLDEEDDLVVTLHKQAPTLLMHRIGPLERLTTSERTTRIRVQP